MRGAVGTAVSVAAALASGTPTPAAAAGSSYPNIVFILVDDLGESGVAFNNPHVLGPRVRELREEGLLLSRHYVYKYCSPTRGSMLTGRYPWRLGSMRSNFIPWSRPDGLRPDFDLLPQRLKSLPPLGGEAARGGSGSGSGGSGSGSGSGGTYATHHVGKW